MVANRRVTGGDVGKGSEQTLHVVIGYVDARAGPDGPCIALRSSRRAWSR
jgi:hypothetical protein